MTRLEPSSALIFAAFFALSGCGLFDASVPPARGSETVLVQQQAVAAAPLTHTITVYPDGRFVPAILDAFEGDTVTFTGISGIAGLLPLRTTDAVVQTTEADLLAAAATGTSCMTSSLPYDTSKMLPGDVNELTGPLRRGTSGIYALGPEDSDGYYEGAVTASCDAIGADAGSAVAAVDAGETWLETTDSDAGTKLCRKYADGKPTKRSNSRFLLQSTWDNPDVTGAVVRINWADLYTQTVSGNVTTISPDYSKLDTELDNAARRGKLVLLEVLAGAGIPPWLFKVDAGQFETSATHLDAGTVVPIYTNDFGSDTDDNLPSARSCGYDKTMGSPADPNYQFALLQTLRDIAEHIRLRSDRYQALGSFKVTGLNFLTGEMRLPKRCLDPRVVNDAGVSQSRCWCNTRIWAAPLNSDIKAFDEIDGGPRAPTVKGGGYTEAAAQSFMNEVENTLYTALGRRKTMHFMLIQDGFPKVFDATHYEMESGAVWPNLGYFYPDGGARYDQQTVDALDRGQAGNFRTPDGGAPLDGGDPDAPALFSPMHAGLGLIPVDPITQLNLCPNPLANSIVNGKLEAAVAAPGVMPTNRAAYAINSGGCPNRWAVSEGYQGQLIGFQTKNTGDVATADDLSASLWNGTLNSNMVFLEAYEVVLWKARARGGAPLSTVASGYADTTDRQKNLGQWAAELHRRRRSIAGFPENALNRHLKDPFPDAYSIRLGKPLALNQVESHFFINPAARCGAGTLASGRINVTGR